MACFRLFAFYPELLYCTNNLLLDQMSNVRIIFPFKHSSNRSSNNVCLLTLLINNNNNNIQDGA